ncbi:acyltransferase family protein [Pseudomonas oryzae]|uniref:Peptidoglycan/LPS O-acetylase OafA/YrhL, contains acyltransferase and SGNH-hydrolase domains n=1 Tax=Pseudomonas oryzae TaxID=1392877 RepID=A0A1H1VTE3_9PSED|nr:acyltransferase family protein [Pseudomonas oryzae]SDS87925.1 Peptidoglycan/LPS O-acetylase OafA/YrhL, contains acyltransferase and SGNH-hydrolase domains [Pseudomonas oryzae]
MARQGHDLKSHYRPDIDGLRAIAVLAVVFFHIDPDFLPGGFVGVDIFFVISGFLITGNIIKDMRSPGGFSWGEFYRRRILRILPVMFVVVLTVLVVGQFVLLPADNLQLAYSAGASVLSAANIYFTYFLDTSYFADDSRLQPLLHLWSLGVEEQFYLFWPLLLVSLVGRMSTIRLLLLALLLGLASFVLAEALLKRAPMFAYYMLPTRAGELLIGAMLAIWLSGNRRVLTPPVATLVGLTGIGLIAASLAWLEEGMGFPGANALPSTLGAALFILAGSGGSNKIGQLVSLRPLVLVGLVSYSLYLWHWPVLAFYRYAFGAVDALDGGLLLVLMLALSVFSYRYVEKPCRQLRWSFDRTVIGFFGAGSLVVLLVCSGLFITNGYGVYFANDDYRRALTSLEPALPAYRYPYVCQRWEVKAQDLNSDACVLNSVGEPDVLLWGDSNAAHYVGVLGMIARHAGFAFRNVAHSSCPPVFSGADKALKVLRPDRVEPCLRSIEMVRKHIGRYSTVIIGGAWSTYFKANPDFGLAVEQTIDALLAQGKRVIILGQVPGFLALDRKCDQKAIKLTMMSCQSAGYEADRGQSEPNRFLAALADARPSVYYFDVRSVLCRDGRCSAYLNKEPLYFDKTHLSMDGSWATGRALLEQGDLPSFFSDLGGGVSKAANGAVLSSSLSRNLGRFSAPGVLWYPLLGDGREKVWNASVSRSIEEGGVVRITDGRADNYDVMRYRLRGRELGKVVNGSNGLMVRVQFVGCRRGNPLLRVWTKGAELRTHDVLLHCEPGQLQAKDNMQQQNVSVTFEGDNQMLYAYLPLDRGVTEVEVGLYPAVADGTGKYSKEFTGSLRVRSVDVAGTHGR